LLIFVFTNNGYTIVFDWDEKVRATSNDENKISKWFS